MNFFWWSAEKRAQRWMWRKNSTNQLENVFVKKKHNNNNKKQQHIYSPCSVCDLVGCRTGNNSLQSQHVQENISASVLSTVLATNSCLGAKVQSEFYRDDRKHSYTLKHLHPMCVPGPLSCESHRSSVSGTFLRAVWPAAPSNATSASDQLITNEQKGFFYIRHRERSC